MPRGGATNRPPPAHNGWHISLPLPLQQQGVVKIARVNRHRGTSKEGKVLYKRVAFLRTQNGSKFSVKSQLRRSWLCKAPSVPTTRQVLDNVNYLPPFLPYCVPATPPSIHAQAFRGQATPFRICILMSPRDVWVSVLRESPCSDPHWGWAAVGRSPGLPTLVPVSATKATKQWFI